MINSRISEISYRIFYENDRCIIAFSDDPYCMFYPFHSTCIYDGWSIEINPTLLWNYHYETLYDIDCQRICCCFMARECNFVLLNNLGNGTKRIHNYCSLAYDEWGLKWVAIHQTKEIPKMHCKMINEHNTNSLIVLLIFQFCKLIF